MTTRNIFLAAAAGSLITAPVAVQAANGGSLERSSMPSGDGSELGGGIGAGLIIAALAAVGMLALILADDDDDDIAVSP